MPHASGEHCANIEFVYGTTRLLILEYGLVVELASTVVPISAPKDDIFQLPPISDILGHLLDIISHSHISGNRRHEIQE